MKKKWMAVILAAFLALPPGTEAKAFDGASILGRILSSGSIYFDQDTMKDTTRNGERRVTATVKNEFTKAGARAVEESSHGEVDRDEAAYSLFLVDFGEKDCFIASPVIYYDRKGKELTRKKASLAYADVTGMNYGKPYSPGSMELKIKEKVFAYADRVKEEEKERTAENR